MIDIHSHILPGIDDGAKDLATAVEMAQLYLDNGFHHVVATPHWLDDVNKNPAADSRQAITSLQQELARRKMPLQLHHGGEFFISLDILAALKKGTGVSLANSRYVLVEFPMRDCSAFIETAVFQLLVKGYVPIIAHPERYSYVIDDPNLVYQWIEKGALIQLNMPSLMGMYGKKAEKTAEILLRHQMVHFLGTDAHSPRRRSPNVQPALSIAKKLIGADRVEKLMVMNPTHILQNKRLHPQPSKEYTRRKWFF